MDSKMKIEFNGIYVFVIGLMSLSVRNNIFATPTSCPKSTDKIKTVGWCNSNGSVTLWDCASCPAGYGFSVECGRVYENETVFECQPCKDGKTYSTTYDISQCEPCSRCLENEVQTGQCMRDKDNIKCSCKPGYYKRGGHCKPCSWCCGDKSNEHVPDCNIRQVPPEKQCLQTTKSCAPTTLPPTSVTTDTRKSGDDEWILPVINVLVVIVVFLFVYCCWKRCGKSSEGDSAQVSISTSTSNDLNNTAQLLAEDKEKDKSTKGDKQIQIYIPDGAAIYINRTQKAHEPLLPRYQRDHNDCASSSEEHVHLEGQNINATSYYVGPHQAKSQPSMPRDCEDESARKEKNEQQRKMIHNTYGPGVVNMPFDVMHEVGLMLNPIQKEKGNDYQMVAEKIGMSYYERENLARGDPMKLVFEVMISLVMQVDKFVDILFKIGRDDVVQRMYDMALDQSVASQSARA